MHDEGTTKLHSELQLSLESLQLCFPRAVQTSLVSEGGNRKEGRSDLMGVISAGWSTVRRVKSRSGGRREEREETKEGAGRGDLMVE